MSCTFLLFQQVWQCIVCVCELQICDGAKSAVPSQIWICHQNNNSKKKCPQFSLFFINKVYFNSAAQRSGCPRPHTSNKAVAEDVFALRLVFRPVPLSQSRTISINPPPSHLPTDPTVKKAFQPGSRIKLTPGATSAKEFRGTPAWAKQLSGPVGFHFVLSVTRLENKTRSQESEEKK